MDITFVSKAVVLFRCRRLGDDFPFFSGFICFHCGQQQVMQEKHVELVNV